MGRHELHFDCKKCNENAGKYAKVKSNLGNCGTSKIVQTNRDIWYT